MTFIHICVGFVITIAILLATGCFGFLIDRANGSCDDTEMWLLAWAISSIGFAVCLTILLFQNGIIKM